MRHLLQPRVLNQASLAAALSALACYPELSLWLKRPEPVWYLEATIFLCGIVLWGFVFAWHAPYTKQPAFSFKQPTKPFVAATITGVVAVIAFHFWLDPVLRPKLPEEYPTDLKHFLALVPFSLALTQLFLVFAPFDWLMRLLKNPWVAAVLTGLLVAGVLALKLNAQKVAVSTPEEIFLLLARGIAGFLAAWFYWRGGVVLVWWWALIFETRYLLNLTGIW